MLTKVFMGTTAAAVAALAIVFWLLLSAKEANGVLQQGIETAAGVNARQAATITEVQENHTNLLKQMEAQRLRTKRANESLALTQMKLRDANIEFDQRLKDALEGMTHEELECSAEFVPAGLINSLHDPNGPVGP